MTNQEQPKFSLFWGVGVGAHQGPGAHGTPVAFPALLSCEECVQGIDRGQRVPRAQQEVAGNHQIVKAQCSGEIEPRPKRGRAAQPDPGHYFIRFEVLLMAYDILVPHGPPGRITGQMDESKDL